MVFKCCVPNCKGNYDAENKVSVFSFPKDDFLRTAWLHAIPRKDFVWTKNLRVSIFNIPAYLYWEITLLLLIYFIATKIHIQCRLKCIFIIVYNNFLNNFYRKVYF